jgi:hypothetical protein
MNFELTCKNDTNETIVKFRADYLDDVLMRIDMFLKGCGYVYDGNLRIDEYETVVDSDSENISFDFSNSAQQKFNFDGLPDNNWPFVGAGAQPCDHVYTASVDDLSSIHIDINDSVKK